ncbi:CHAT domain-containing tetratricopeptide repeat protein [Candidatus Protochlamydia sp. W-9]|uniref:CHAT domain-containing tetratricopeptide repeat protein n=1 Tax=Candidatus Protochlamydia sp. W-9 TaxID=1785087 RepID=UPI0009AE5CD5|nr:CHAT domain-containing protein [Candidatus Protochlamydia sp. W-9]
MPVFDFATFLYDIQHDQAQQLIDLEEIISEIMEAKLKSNELNLIIPICLTYQNILEHLWLLPYLEFGNRCANLLNQNKGAILNHMERWKDSLNQLASEEKIDKSIPTNLEKFVLRLFEPLPEAVAKEIEEQKSAIHKSGEISLTLLEIIADFYGIQKDFPRAIFHAEIILNFLIQELPKTSQKEEFLVKIMQMHGNLADWNQLLRRYSMAIDHSERVLKIAVELSDHDAIFISLKKLGYLYVAQGKNELALPFYQKALTIAQTLQDSEIEKQFLGALADVYTHIGNNEEVIRYYQATLKLAEEKTEQALIYSGIGEAHAKAKQYKEAEEAYGKALEILPQGNNPLMAIIVHQKLAKFFKNFGRYGKAIYHAEKILELIQHPSIQVDELQAQESKFSALTILGSIYGTFGDHARKIDYRTQAVKLAEKADVDLNGLGVAYANLGSAYCDEENYSEGIKYYHKASEILKGNSNRANFLKNFGRILFSSGRFSEAIEYYKEANKIGNQDTKKGILLGLGLCYDALGNKEQAIQCIEKFICLSQASKDRLNEALGYHNLGIIYKESDLGLAEENYRKSIAISDALHQELKSHSQWQITFFEEQASTLLSLENLLLKQGKTEEALQITDFRRSRALVSALTKKIQLQKDDFLTSGVTIQEMQALAYKMNTCLIVYSFASESTDSITVWIIPSDGEIICKPLPLGILTEEVKETNKLFQTLPFIAEARTIETPLSSFLEELTRGESEENTHLSNSQTFKNRLKNWYEILIAPIASYLPKDPQQVVTIIPDGYLAQIPFAAFLDKEGTYLIEKHPLSIAPSIQALTLLDQLPKDFSKNSLVIGNPNTSERSLKFAEKEAQTIVAPLLETDPKKVLLQDKATIHAVVKGMADARWIHLACHGSTGKKPDEKLDPHSVFEGLFKLTPDESHPQGYLHAQEIAALALRAELVFMSACFSGRGKDHEEGIVDPVWSFLAAGALSTIATYWRLPDTELTLQMVETFYRHLLGIEVEKLNKAQALQKAMLVGIEQARERPDRWGAFFLSGLHE